MTWFGLKPRFRPSCEATQSGTRHSSLVFVGFAMMSLGPVLLLWVSGNTEVPWPYALALLPAFLGVALAVVLVVGTVRGNQTWNSSIAFQHPIRYTFSRDQLEISARGQLSKTDLAAVHGVEETAGHFVVYLTSAVILILPKKAIGNSEVISHVREILRSGLPGTAKVRLRT